MQICTKHITRFSPKEVTFKVTILVFKPSVTLHLIAWNISEEGWGDRSWEKEQNWYWGNNILRTLDNVIHNSIILQNETIAPLYSFSTTTLGTICSALSLILSEQQLGGSLEECTGMIRGLNILIYVERLRAKYMQLG